MISIDSIKVENNLGDSKKENIALKSKDEEEA